VVNAASLYQVVVPVEQVAESIELCPEHIVAGLADTAVGAEGVAFTVTAALPEGLLQTPPLTQAT
jgi:hypothetical protein